MAFGLFDGLTGVGRVGIRSVTVVVFCVLWGVFQDSLIWRQMHKMGYVTTSSEIELIREILTPRSSEGTVTPNLYYANY